MKATGWETGDAWNGRSPKKLLSAPTTLNWRYHAGLRQKFHFLSYYRLFQMTQSIVLGECVL